MRALKEGDESSFVETCRDFLQLWKGGNLSAPTSAAADRDKAGVAMVRPSRKNTLVGRRPGESETGALLGDPSVLGRSEGIDG